VCFTELIKYKNMNMNIMLQLLFVVIARRVELQVSMHHRQFFRFLLFYIILICTIVPSL
jgi:hypothetical protein